MVPAGPSLISLMVSVDVKHHVYLLTLLVLGQWSLLLVVLLRPWLLLGALVILIMWHHINCTISCPKKTYSDAEWWCWLSNSTLLKVQLKKKKLKTCKTKSKSKTKYPPTRSLLGPTSIEFQFQEYLDGHRQNPSWCLVVRTTYLCTCGKVTSNTLWNTLN